MPIAFVTGGTGFLGINLIHQLLAGDWDLIVLHRPTSNLKYLDNCKVTFVEGSILDINFLNSAIPKRVDAIFHVAGNTSMWSKSDHIQTLENVNGTQNIISAAMHCEAKKLIYTSSVAVYGHHQSRVNEETKSNATESPINYFRSKYLAELEIRNGLKNGLDVVILNPAHIIGAYDSHNLSQLFFLIEKGKFPLAPRSVHTFCHVQEVAKAHISAYHYGKIGDNYILGGIESDYLTIAKHIAKLLGKSSPFGTAPNWVLETYGRLSSAISYFTNKEPDITYEKAFLLGTNMLFDSNRAEKRLGYKKVALDIMLEDCYSWLKKEKLIRIY